uniref:Ig-like domain-containing protein n=1 Tax=Zonotrichia albicollis TaxID=44394 RepID=A0A8D2NIW2_ZONAL
PPFFDVKPVSIDVALGESATFKCHLTGSAPMRITWTRDNREIRPGGNYKMTLVENTASLTVLKVGKGDAGLYTCTALFCCSKNFSDLHFIAEPAVIVEKPGPVKVTAGDCCTLECTVDGTPELTARWFKDGNELSTDHKYKISFFNKVSGLKILNATLEDKSPSFVKKPEPLDVLSGANITFTSIVKGSPPLEVKWFRGSVELVPGPRCNITLQDSVAELELFDVHPLESGDYTCQVSNEAGKISCTTHLFVKEKGPIFLKYAFRKTTILTSVIDLNSTPTKRKEEEEQPIDILELLKNVDPKEYEKYARMYGITDFRGLLGEARSTAELYLVTKG